MATTRSTTRRDSRSRRTGSSWSRRDISSPNDRATREREYARTLRIAAALAVVLHLIVFVSLTPLRIPLVRHLGYEGPLRILPEIAEFRAPGPVESEVESFSGRGGERTLRAIDLNVVEEGETSAAAGRRESGERDETRGEETLTQLERSLPQPTSRDLVIVTLVKPVYPRSSVEAGVEGVVTFRVHVKSDGTVVRVWLLRSEVDRACEESARRALLQWRFRPFLVDGEPTDVLVDQRIRFSLIDTGTAPS